VALFTFASFACGLVHSLPEMVTFRTIQGFGEALIMVTAQAMVFSFFPPEKRGLAMGVFALGVAFAPAVGPTLGGYLAENFGWRSLFFVNVPVGVLLLIFGLLLLPNTRPPKSYPLNFLSLTFLTGFTLSLLILLSKGEQLGWFNSNLITGLAWTSWISLLLFILSELLSPTPLFDYTLFRRPHYTIGIIVYFTLLGFSMYQYFYLIPIYYEQLKGFSSIQTGLGVLGFGIWIGVFSILAGGLSDRFSPVPILFFSALLYLFTTAFLFPTLNYYTPFYEAVIKTAPLGVVMGLFFAPITLMVMKSSGEKVEQGVMMMDYVRFIGGSFGTAIATNNLHYFTNKEFQGIATLQNWELTGQLLHHLMEKWGEKGVALWAKFQELMAFNYAFKWVWLDAFYWGVIGIVALLILPLFKWREEGEQKAVK
jgi:DHA2 family multidrug resistance protein